MWTSLSTIGLCLCASKLNINVITTNVSIGMHLSESVHIHEQYVSVEITTRANLLEGGGGLASHRRASQSLPVVPTRWCKKVPYLHPAVVATKLDINILKK